MGQTDLILIHTDSKERKEWLGIHAHIYMHSLHQFFMVTCDFLAL